MVKHFYEIEDYRLISMLEQIADMVKDCEISKSQAVKIVGNLVDMDKFEEETELEKLVFHWIDEINSIN